MYPVVKTNTDDLWHIGMGYPLHFSFQRHMIGATSFVFILFVFPVILASFLIFYNILEVDGSDRKNTGLLIYGSYYSIIQLRVTYGFDFGIWINNNYWYL